jgi:hypothetical protein
MTEPDYAEFDELHRTWLARPHLQLLAIISLARGITPKHWGKAHKEHWCDCLALKAAITTGLLEAHCDDPSQMRYDNTVIYLSDLLKFLGKTGLGYEWLRDFAKRWQSYAGASTPIKRNRSDPEKERDTRGLIDDVLNLGREFQKRNPKLNGSGVIDAIEESGRFRHNYKKETIRQIIYGTYPWMKDRGIKGLSR